MTIANPPHQPMKGLVNSLSEWLVDGLVVLWGLVWVSCCAGCGVRLLRGGGLCPGCRSELQGPPQVRVQSLQGHEQVPVVFLAAYRGTVSRIIVAWKDRSRRDVTAHLARALARGLNSAASSWPAPPAGGAACSPSAGPTRGPGAIPVGGSEAEPILVIPVPSRWQARRERGEDRMARTTALALRLLRTDPEFTGAPRLRLCRGLRVRGTVKDQAGLGAEARRSNLAGAMSIRPMSALGRWQAVAGRRCVVVDDVVTTGASAEEAVRAVNSVGAEVVAVVAICSTPLRREGGNTDRWGTLARRNTGNEP
jgi:predicted amidophosphoribosyltransferase